MSDGIKDFGDLEPGDLILGSDGKPVEVLKVYEEHLPETMWEIEVEDGSTMKVSGNHLWYVETNHDYSLHSERRRIGRKHFGKLSKEKIGLLERLAYSEDEVETSLIDMVVLLQAVGSREATRAVERVAESIGHIAENAEEFEDIETGETFKDTTVRTYDARLFAQQVLSLSGLKKYKKNWPLVSGKVVTTLDLIELGDDVEIPLMESKG